MFCSWLDLPINDKRNEGCPDCVLSDQAARNEKLLVQLHVRTPSPSSLSSDHRCCPNKWVFHPKMVRLRVQWWSIGMGLRSCFSRRRPDFSMALHRPNRPKLVGFQEWKMAIFFHEKRGYKKHKKKTLYGFPSDGIVWSWHVPKLDAGMDTADGRLPLMISAESWSEEFFGSPPAAGSRWTLGLCETSRSDRCKLYGDSGLWSGGQQTLQTTSF